MWEGLAAVTGIELGKLILEQVLDLGKSAGKSALEDYVKDFFKDCLESGIARARASDLKQPMAEAIGCFIKRFVKELEFHDVPDTSIDHHYQPAIKQFVRDQSVRPILGKAFEKDCKQIDYQKLERIWMQQYQPGGCYFPQEFDWRGVAGEYVREVKVIIKADAELRSILDSDLLEEIAQNTAKLSPGFDIEKYRESLQSSYGYLKLYTLDSTDRADPIRLWNLFIEQTVREALPPMRYDLPLDLKRQLQEAGQLEDLSPEALENYRHEYFQQPSQKALAAVAEAERAVILGDPGAGKSTLLQYLALEWVEGKTETLPLLIELREYGLAQSESILDFLHSGRGADWQFDQQQLHQHLVDTPTLVMFDGLDEVFDRHTQSAIVDEIILFAQRYPLAKVLVTSRIIGYNPDRFRHAEFRQFTIQPLDETEVHEFIDRWYDLAMGSDTDKVRLKERLKDAIENSRAIANLADNPLLLTMMAILNRRQELPRDRADLYDQASRVLLYHWDVDHKRLQLPMEAIGRREKQEMLRLIAYEMQAGAEGLKGNLIGVNWLTQILTDYLRDQGFSEPREKANLLIQQLRERNFILCYRGADTYGFMHRTFLEYFCAVEIVNRFEKQRSISFEELRDRVFGEHWQDETWHEVLRLICGMIDAKSASRLINFLIEVKPNCTNSPANEDIDKISRKLLLAANCITDVEKCLAFEESAMLLLQTLENLTSFKLRLKFESPAAFFHTMIDLCKENPKTVSWLKEIAEDEMPMSNLAEDDWRYLNAQSIAVEVVAERYREKLETLLWLHSLARCIDPCLSRTAIDMLAAYYKEDPETLPLLYNLVENGELYQKENVIAAISTYYRGDLPALKLLRLCLQKDEVSICYSAFEAISKYFSKLPNVFDLLCEIAHNGLFDPENKVQSDSLKTILD
ncbi:NTPase (NACHT family), partial [filamentous cyanobacterium CCP1]